MSPIDKSVETENGLVLARGCGEMELGITANEYRRRQWHPTPVCLENPIDGGAW